MRFTWGEDQRIKRIGRVFQTTPKISYIQDSIALFLKNVSLTNDSISRQIMDAYGIIYNIWQESVAQVDCNQTLFLINPEIGTTMNKDQSF